MNNYPECDKMIKVRDKSQAIGEFLDWLHNEKNVSFRQPLTEEAIEAEIAFFRDNESDWRGKKYSDYPQNDNDFEEAMEAKRKSLRNKTVPFFLQTESLLAEYFEIDLHKIEHEKREMLKQLQSAQ